MFLLAEIAISYYSKLQSIIALSIYETKYVAICETNKKII